MRIVVAVDGSEASHAALCWAVALAETFDGDVLAVHAVGLLEEVHDADDTTGSWRSGVANLVEKTWCAGLAQARCPHRVLVRDGPAVDVLLGVIHDERASMLVVGSRGAGAKEPALALGSTSLHLLQRARVPVVVVPEGHRTPARAADLGLRHILVGVDRSDPSMAALGVAADVAGATGAALTVAEIVEYVPPFPLRPAAAGDQGEGTAVEETRAALEDRVRAIRDRDIATQVVVRSGDPAPALLRIAADVHADLVVVGTRGRGDPARPLLGSVARTVVNGVGRPTLVIPAAAGEVHLPPTRDAAPRPAERLS